MEKGVVAGKRKGERHPFSPQVPPVLFSHVGFLNFADPTSLEPGTGYSKINVL